MNKKRIKHIVNAVIWPIVAIYFLLVILLQTPAVQGYIGNIASNSLEKKLGTIVSIGKINIGLFNRIIIDDVILKDQNNNNLLKAGRISAKFDIISILEGKISLSSAQLFGLKINAYKTDANTKPNYQFLLDSLASKNPNDSSVLNLNINSLIVRNGSIAYNQLDTKRSTRGIDVKHINVDNISGHFILNKISEDSVNISIKSLSLHEQSGLKINNIHFSFYANNKKAQLKNFTLKMPNSEIALGNTFIEYEKESGKLIEASVSYEAELKKSVIVPSDFAFIDYSLQKFNNPINLYAEINGTSTSLRLKQLKLTTKYTKLLLNGSIRNWQLNPRWSAKIEKFNISSEGIKYISNNTPKNIKLPKVLTSIGDISFFGQVGGYNKDFATTGVLKTGAGSANLALGKHMFDYTARIVTSNLQLNKILNNNKFGSIATKINIDGTIKNEKNINLKATGDISHFECNGYCYHNIIVNGNLNKTNANMAFNGMIGINDPNGKISIKGELSKKQNLSTANIIAEVDRLNIKAMKLYNKFPGNNISFNINANLKGTSINNAIGNINITNLVVTEKDNNYVLNNISINSGFEQGRHFVNMNSDFGKANIVGFFDYSSLPQSISNIIRNKLPTLPELPPYQKSNNSFALNLRLTKTDWLQKLLGINLEVIQPIAMHGEVNDQQKIIDLTASLPKFKYNGTTYESFVRMNTPNDTLTTDIHLKRINNKDNDFLWYIHAKAVDNKLHSSISWDNQSKNIFKGKLVSDANFYKTEKGQPAAHIKILPSDILVGDTVWNIKPADISYYANHLDISNLSVQHKKQHIIINGTATKNKEDNIQVDLNDVDVKYILNLVNFHSVDFSGQASGNASISSVFSDPQAEANLSVRNFRFQDGRMGTLEANVNYWNEEGQINIDAYTHDEGMKNTFIKGYVSPKHNSIDLNIDAEGTRLEFIEDFCGSFMKNVEATVAGNVRVYGPLNNINLTGKVVANGPVTISSLNTTYEMINDTVLIVPDHIIFQRDTVYDRNSNIGILSGSVDHKHLTNFKFYLNIEAKNLLAYDTHEFGNNTFYGTAYATGNCTIDGRNDGEVLIDVKATPEKGSQIVYNAASNTALTNQEFIHWTSRDIPTDSLHKKSINEDNKLSIPTNLHLNLLINMTPDATLRLLMDQQSGDYIALNGSGGLRATYYNKGGFDIYGSYLIDHGTYKLTIQNVIKKEFLFQQGGSIVFGGDPYNASLHLKAVHSIAGVSLSDLNIGRSFTNNNIRVNCLMDITGTPSTPKVGFGLDLPTINDDAKQMIFSLINSEEEMNQQVLYLLAVGRFYTTGNNNANINGTQQYSQTSLAMQSIISGTVSQQINSVLSNVINNTNWNFGANISTGDEGWNNAEYEGVLSGRMLNNRLLFNGQFGYRDNPNATTSFIGDFDLRYLIVPNGNFAIRVYNQTNDRYFTRNSLNTQGIGIILKKDFFNIKDLLGIKRTSNKPSTSDKKE